MLLHDLFNLNLRRQIPAGEIMVAVVQNKTILTASHKLKLHFKNDAQHVNHQEPQDQ
jgi:hypothetical protein